MRFDLSSKDNKLAIILAPVVVLAFPFVNLFVFHHYSFINTEVGVLFAGVVLLGLVLGLINMSHPIVRTVFLSMLITLALTLQLDLSLHLLLGLLVLLVAVGAVLHRFFCKFTIVFFLTMSVVALVQGSGNVVEQVDVKPRDPDLPAYVHVIFDGHIGIEGIPLDVPGGHRLKQELNDFFSRHGFSLYSKAYSRYVATINSLGNLFNFSNTTVNNFKPNDKLKNQASNLLSKPKYFELLNQQGYALRIMHPYYLDYCSANSDWVSFCRQYPNMNLRSIEDSDLTINEKISLTIELLIKQSDLVESYYQSLRRRFDLPELEISRVPAINEKMMHAMFDDLRKHGRGYAHVWHLLFPHAPFSYGSDCVLRTERPFVETRPLDKVEATVVEDQILVQKGHNTSRSRSLRYQHYFEQVRCGLRWFEQMLSVLRETGAYNDAIIIVHGDHGSKISNLVAFSLWKDQLRGADYIDTYSTLYAIKGNGKPQKNDRFLSLNEIFTSSINNMFAVDLHVPTEPFVYMQSHAANSPLEKVTVRDFLVPVPEVQ